MKIKNYIDYYLKLRRAAKVSVISVFICVIYMCTNVFASFEDIGVGARPIGMGNAFTALSDDVHAIYYNPAGLGKVTRSEITSGYGRLFWGLDDDSNLGSSFFGYAQPINLPRSSASERNKWGTLGFGYLNFSLGGHYAENTFLLSYGNNVWKQLSLGVNLKVLQKVVGQDMYTEIDPVFDYGRRSSKTGYSVDFGSLFNITSRLSIALSLTDINQPDMIFHKTIQSQSSKVPLGVKTGIAYHEDSLNIAVDAAFKESVVGNKTDVKVYTGAEKWFSNYTFALRGGLGLGSREYKNMTIGASYKTGIFRFDYAFILPLSGIEETSGSHRISLTLLFGPDKEELSRKVVREDLEKRLIETEKTLEEVKKEVEQTKVKLEKAGKELEKNRQETEQAHNKIKQLETEQVDGKRLEEAKKSYERAVRKEKQGKYNYWFVMGERYVEYGKWEDALKAYKKALEHKPGDRKAVNEIKYIQKEMKKLRPKTKQEEEISEQKLKQYTVKKGDTLPSIAEKVYGDSFRWKEIYEANKDKVVEGKLKQGQVLVIP